MSVTYSQRCIINMFYYCPILIRAHLYSLRSDCFEPTDHYSMSISLGFHVRAICGM